MEKKVIQRIANKNLSFLIITVFGILLFMQKLSYAFGALHRGGVLNNIEYSILELKLIITMPMQGGFNATYIVGYYPLVGILAGIIYNSYIIIKNLINKRKKTYNIKN